MMYFRNDSCVLLTTHYKNMFYNIFFEKYLVIS